MNLTREQYLASVEEYIQSYKLVAEDKLPDGWNKHTTHLSPPVQEMVQGLGGIFKDYQKWHLRTVKSREDPSRLLLVIYDTAQPPLSPVETERQRLLRRPVSEIIGYRFNWGNLVRDGLSIGSMGVKYNINMCIVIL